MAVFLIRSVRSNRITKQPIYFAAPLDHRIKKLTCWPMTHQLLATHLTHDSLSTLILGFCGRRYQPTTVNLMRTHTKAFTPTLTLSANLFTVTQTSTFILTVPVTSTGAVLCTFPRTPNLYSPTKHCRNGVCQNSGCRTSHLHPLFLSFCVVSSHMIIIPLS
jgi:hypothetical protein